MVVVVSALCVVRVEGREVLIVVSSLRRTGAQPTSACRRQVCLVSFTRTDRRSLWLLTLVVAAAAWAAVGGMGTMAAAGIRALWCLCKQQAASVD